MIYNTVFVKHSHGKVPHVQSTAVIIIDLRKRKSRQRRWWFCRRRWKGKKRNYFAWIKGQVLSDSLIPVLWCWHYESNGWKIVMESVYCISGNRPDGNFQIIKNKLSRESTHPFYRIYPIYRIDFKSPIKVFYFFVHPSPAKIYWYTYFFSYINNR